MSRLIGIDLGTTNSLVAVMESGKPVIIPSSEGEYLFPSVVGFTKDGDRLVGSLAKRQAVSFPERTISSIKRHMGTDYKVEIDGKTYTPQEISAMILQKIKADAEIYLGEPVEKAVITVPAYFNDSERQATKDAGTIAGLEVVRIINEPTASSMAYGFDKLDKVETILVWDLGGGTFDVSILEIGSGVFEVKATCGNMKLGGDDWDLRVMNWIVDEFKKLHNIDLKTDRVAMQRIKEASEAAKIDLSSALETRINMPFISSDASGPKHLDMLLTRDKLNALTKDLVDMTEEPAKKAMEDAKLRSGQINKIIMVGGASQMPAVIYKAKELFGKEPYRDVDPEKVVALGAAIQAGVLSGEVKDLLLLDVTSLSLGIETVGGVFTRLIERNTQIPCKNSRVFTTVADGQSAVKIHVLQGEREIASHNKTLGYFELQNIPSAPKGVPQIEVGFEIDANGIVNVSATDLLTKNKQKIKIDTPTNLTQFEVDRLVKEAEKYAVEDKLVKGQKTVKVKAQIEIDLAVKAINDLGEKIPSQDSTQIKEILESLKKFMSKDDLDQIEAHTRKLKDRVYAVTSRIYDETRKKEGAKKDSHKEKISNISDNEVLDWFKK
ncbi:MAG: molecular chaperone DnaK [Armatimonadota bacterium]